MPSIEDFPQDMTEAEKLVFDTLTNGLKLTARYESPLFLFDDANRPRVWTPDFFLPLFGIYIEVIGSKTIAETAKGKYSYSYREKVYELNNIPIIFLKVYEKNWQTQLVFQIIILQDMREEFIQNVILRNASLESIMTKENQITWDKFREKNRETMKISRTDKMWREESEMKEREKKKAAEKAVKTLQELLKAEASEDAVVDSKNQEEADKVDKDKDMD